MATYLLDDIIGTLKTAREAEGLSQRDLSAKSRVPQSHISRIENGAVDLRTSSLVELARVLDLELVLVPRRAIPAVRSIAKDLARRHRGSGEPLSPVPPAYSLDDEDDG